MTAKIRRIPISELRLRARCQANASRRPVKAAEPTAHERLRETLEEIREKIANLDVEKRRAFLKEMHSIYQRFSPLSGIKDTLLSYVANEYALTFENDQHGSLKAWTDLGAFTTKLSLSYLLENMPEGVTLETISHRYGPEPTNVRILLTKFSAKQIVNAYSQRRKKEDALFALTRCGYSLKGLRAMGIRIKKGQIESIFG